MYLPIEQRKARMEKVNNPAGITAGGNWIVDKVKTVDCLPEPGMLANIKSEHTGTGGAPANVLVDLAKMAAPFPLAGAGVIGRDEAGAFILETCRKYKIDVSGMRTVTGAPTSYTDVMNEEASGRRTFFHHRGANAFFTPDSVAVESLSCRIFHLGYLLLLDGMDAADSEYGTAATRFLHSVQKAGIKTSVDVVSETSGRFRTIVPPALKYVDYLILNEIEAGLITGRGIRGANDSLDNRALIEAVEELSKLGDMELIAVHMPEGAYMRDRKGARLSCGSLILPDGFIQSTVGAGDAFCAGMLYGIHEGWDWGKAAGLGVCAAAACLSRTNTTDGLRPAEELLALAKRFPERTPPVSL